MQQIFQENPGWCGPAVIQMVLLASGISKTQAEIAKDVYLPWWGTTGPAILAYLSQFFKTVNYQEKSSLDDLSSHLKMGHIVILDWWDDLDKNESPGGHYSIVDKYENDTLTLIDPSNSRSGVWTVNGTEFVKKWFDTLDIRDEVKLSGWMLWLDPASKI